MTNRPIYIYAHAIMDITYALAPNRHKAISSNHADLITTILLYTHIITSNKQDSNEVLKLYPIDFFNVYWECWVDHFFDSAWTWSHRFRAVKESSPPGSHGGWFGHIALLFYVAPAVLQLSGRPVDPDINFFFFFLGGGGLSGTIKEINFIWNYIINFVRNKQFPHESIHGKIYMKCCLLGSACL